MIASTSHRALLKRAFPELAHTNPQFLRPFKRQRFSPAITSWGHFGATSPLRNSPPYFLSNSRRGKFYLISDARSPIKQFNLDVVDDPPTFVKAQTESSASGDGLSSYKPVPPLTFSRLMKAYGQLAKSRLTSLVVLTSMSGVALSPFPTTVSVLLATAMGTALCSASANAINQLAEVPFDAQMARTRMRPLVRGAISSTHATGFAIATGLAGPAILATFCNPVAALLGIANIGLYAGVYTSLKRSSVVNTWVGSVVGGIPPLIGWTACGGRLFPSSTYPIEFFLPPFLSDLTTTIPLEHIDNPLSALALFCLAFSWQFPHFNPLAYTVRDSYAQAGYKMLAVTNPSLNALVSLRHAGTLVGICSVLVPLSGLTTWTFAITSLIPNAFLSKAAWKFWRIGTEKEAKTLFHTSLWYLPVVLALMMFHKQEMDWLEFIGWRDKTSPKDEPDPTVSR